VVFAERRAHGIVVNCKYVKQHLVEDEGFAPAKIRVCYNGIDLDRFRRGIATHPPTLPADALVIGVICVLRPEKGLTTLIDAFAKVWQPGSKLRLLVVGSGPILGALQQRARDLGIYDVCVFEPSTDRVEEWLRTIDIFVLPSLSEALSNSLMEAMACGCCPVASRVGGNPELIEDGKRGLLFEPGNSDELAAKLRELINSPELRISLATAAHDFLHANFSRAISVRRMTEIYGEFLPETQAG